MPFHRNPIGFRLAALLLRPAVAVLPAISCAEDATAPASPPALVRASLIAESSNLQRGKTGWVAIRLTMKPGWHTYWRNPGDSGLATSVKWTLPLGVSAEPIVWPQPDRFVARTIVGYGYSGEVALLTGVKVPSKLASDKVKIDAVVSWLACASVCIPGSEKLTIALPVSDAAPRPDPQNASLFVRARRQIPQPAPFEATFVMDNEQIRLSFPESTVARFSRPNAMFYPFDNSVIEHGAPQSMVVGPRQIELTLQRSVVSNDQIRTLDGLLILEDAAQRSAGPRAYAVSARRATAADQ